MKNIAKRFRSKDDGAVTVDWVVLTAAIVGIGASVVVSVRAASIGIAGEIGANIEATSVGSD